ncbi:MAG: hypothetical protein U0174_27770 [Polyangiaceae bacterium]
MNDKKSLNLSIRRTRHGLRTDVNTGAKELAGSIRTLQPTGCGYYTGSLSDGNGQPKPGGTVA